MIEHRGPGQVHLSLLGRYEPLSDQLMDLADRTKKIEDTANAAREKNRASLEQHRDQLKTDVDSQAQAVKGRANEAKENVSSWWEGAKASVDARFSAINASHTQRKAERDVKKPVRRADEAEEDAAGLIALAAYTVEASEYAVIDAALARAEADDLEAAR